MQTETSRVVIAIPLYANHKSAAFICHTSRHANQCAVFLALLDFVSRTTAMAQASVVRKFKFLRHRCMDQGNLSTISLTFFSFFKIFNFQNFTIFFSFSLTWDTMGPKISKRYKLLLHSFHPIKLYDK